MRCRSALGASPLVTTQVTTSARPRGGRDAHACRLGLVTGVLLQPRARPTKRGLHGPLRPACQCRYARAVGDRESNNRPLLIRTLTGWLLHPNVGACVVLQTVSDQVAAESGAGISYDTLRAHAIESGAVAREALILSTS